MLRKLMAMASRLRQAVSNPRVSLDTAIAESPLAPARTFWNSLREMEDWWPVLLPVLLWVFWRTYQRERAALVLPQEQS